MKKLLNIKTAAVALIAVAGGMFFTNPQIKDYESYASQKLAGELQNSVCKKQELPDIKILQDFSKITSDVCKSNVAKGFISENFLVKQLIGSNTKRENLMVLSIYTTQTPDKTFKTIGAFGNFLTFQS
ncbi:MAG: DUF4359 domain-containing protein [Cyanobacteria bacterium P01_A01_bin.84]